MGSAVIAILNDTFYNFYFMILLEFIRFGYYLHQW